MKRIQITETDPKFRVQMAEFLFGLGAVPLLFEVEDDFDIGAYEGVAVVDAGAPEVQGSNFAQGFADVVAWLENYTGTFDFYLSLKHQYAAKGSLSPKQIDSVRRAIERDAANGKAIPQGKVQEFTLKPGTTLVLSKFISNKVAKEAGYTRAHRAVDVVAVEAETPKAFRARVKLSARRTSCCGICGITLENPQSIAAGIGPICADKAGASYGEKSIEELEKILAVTAEVTVWIPKSSIKDRFENEKAGAA